MAASCRHSTILVGLAVLALAGRAAGLEFVRAQGGSFRVCNYTLKFMGFNVRGICHYGHGDILPYSHTYDVDANLDYCQAARAKVIRVFCAYEGIGQVETGDRLGAILDECQSREMWVIVSLTDMYHTGFSPQGDEVYHTIGTYAMLNHTFFASGYTNNYLPQALYLANRFKNHPAVFAWQLGNEIRDLSSGSTFVAFCQNVAAQIRAVDPNHMVNPGLICWQQSSITYSQALQLYGSMDFVGSHPYNGSDSFDDSGLANQLGKPYVLDEAAFDSGTYGPDRTPEADADIAKWMGRGADGYVQWALMASSYDNGDGDWTFGVDRVFHDSDFYLYRDLFNAWGTSFEAAPTLAVEPTTIEQQIAQGQTAADDTFTVYNLGYGSFSFEVDESVSWLSVSPDQGNAACAGVPITIEYDTGGLGPGTHTGYIYVLASGIAGSPQSVEVDIIVAGCPGDFDGDRDVDQEDFGRFQCCLTGPGGEQTDPACDPAKMDGDSDVDTDDVALFMGCMSGAGNPADPDCANP